MGIKLNKDRLVENYPIKGKESGWYFRIEEISTNVYLIEGKNVDGKQISRQCSENELDNMLGELHINSDDVV